MAIVSQLCISFPYVLHGLCEDYLTCDIAFNAVMPLSRASTRRRYSRIEGVTTRLVVLAMGEVLSFGFNRVVFFPSDRRCSKARIVLLPLRITRWGLYHIA